MYAFYWSCPSATFASQHGGFCTTWMENCKGPITGSSTNRNIIHDCRHVSAGKARDIDPSKDQLASFNWHCWKKRLKIRKLTEILLQNFVKSYRPFNGCETNFPSPTYIQTSVKYREFAELYLCWLTTHEKFRWKLIDIFTNFKAFFLAVLTDFANWPQS